MNDKNKFPDPHGHFPVFFSFVPDDDQDHLRELHYAVFGGNGPVYILQEDPEKPPRQTTMWDMMMEDRAVGLERVFFEDSRWSDRYRPPEES